MGELRIRSRDDTHRFASGKTDVIVTLCHFVWMSTQIHVEEVIVPEATLGERRTSGNTLRSMNKVKEN